jgi:hypothetical protein
LERFETWMGYMSERIVVSVSQNAVVQAESAILGCTKCTLEATMPFWQVVDHFRSHAGFDVVYILPVLATCPNCQGRIDEATLVTPNEAVFPCSSPILAQSKT